MLDIKKTIKKKQREGGFIVSAELIFLTTILVIALLVGMIEIQEAVLNEMNDVAEAIGALDQGFTFDGNTSGSGTALTEGSSFQDTVDNPSVANPYSGGNNVGGDWVLLDVSAPSPTEGELSDNVTPILTP